MFTVSFLAHVMLASVFDATQSLFTRPVRLYRANVRKGMKNVRAAAVLLKIS